MVGNQVGLVEGYNQTAPVRPGWGFGIGPITPHCKDKRDYGYRKLLSCSNIYTLRGKKYLMMMIMIRSGKPKSCNLSGMAGLTGVVNQRIYKIVRKRLNVDLTTRFS